MIIFIFLTTVLSVSVCIRCTNYCDVITKCVCVCVCACRVMMGHGARPWVSDINHPNYIAGRRAVKEGLLLSCQQQHWLMCPPLRLCLFWPDIPRHNSCVFQLTTVLIWSSKQPHLSGTRTKLSRTDRARTRTMAAIPVFILLLLHQLAL